MLNLNHSLESEILVHTKHENIMLIIRKIFKLTSPIGIGNGADKMSPLDSERIVRTETDYTH